MSIKVSSTIRGPPALALPVRRVTCDAGGMYKADDLIVTLNQQPFHTVELLLSSGERITLTHPKQAAVTDTDAVLSCCPASAKDGIHGDWSDLTILRASTPLPPPQRTSGKTTGGETRRLPLRQCV